VIRDPREVAGSFSHHMDKTIAEAVAGMNAPDTTAGREDGFLEPLTTWSNHVGSWLSAPKTISRLVFRFEDLIADRKAAVGALNSFYRFGRGADVVAAIADALSFEALQAEEARDGFDEAVRGRAFFRQGAAESWRDMDPALFAPLTAAQGAAMRQFKYL